MVSQETQNSPSSIELKICSGGENLLQLSCGETVVHFTRSDDGALLQQLLVALLRRCDVGVKEICRVFDWSERSVSRITKTFICDGLRGLWEQFIGGLQALPDLVREFVKTSYRRLRTTTNNFCQQIIEDIKFHWPQLSRGISPSSLRSIFREADREDSSSSEVEAPSRCEPETVGLLPAETRAVDEVIKPEDCGVSEKVIGQAFGAARSILPEEASHERQSDVRSKPFQGGESPQSAQPTAKEPHSEQEPITLNAAVPETPIHSSSLKIFELEQQLHSRFNHHLGLSLFHAELEQFHKSLVVLGIAEKQAQLLLQILVQVLQGSVNNEQLRYVHTASLEQLIGKVLIDTDYQRKLLDKLDEEQIVNALTRTNLELLGGLPYRVIYYDPHNVPYSGAANFLRGFIAARKQIGKMYNIDFFHDLYGRPIFMHHADNYAEPRERFMIQLEKFKKIHPQYKQDSLLHVFDRGLYGVDHFTAILAGNDHFLTWEKGAPERWDETQKIEEFEISRLRNSSRDPQSIRIEHIEIPWEKDPQIRNIVFRVYRNGEVSDPMSVLCSSKQITAESALRVLIGRWLQENDFRFLHKHFGLHQISSYKKTAYLEDMEDPLEKTVVTREYEQLLKDSRELRKKIESIDLLYHRFKSGVDELAAESSELQELQQKIEKHTLEFRQDLKNAESKQKQRQKELTELDKKKKNTARTQPKMQRMAEDKRSSPELIRKRILDLIRIIARNLFIGLRNEIRVYLDDFRIDTDIVFRLCQSVGTMKRTSPQSIKIQLMPKLNLQPCEQERLREYLRKREDVGLRFELCAFEDEIHF
jgi:hypothetical protein